MLGHIIGIPVEESVLQLTAGAASATAVALAARTNLVRLLTQIRRRGSKQ
jgi:hypothetical protein